MSAGGFHVHGPHDHELEHAAQNEPHGTAGQLAVITAILATVGAMFSFMGGEAQTEAGLLKNDAAIKKTEASNQWNYYQAKNGRQYLSDLAAELTAESRKAFYLDEAKRYAREKAEIKLAAEKLEAESKVFDDQSAEKLHQHTRWGQATTALQSSIAIAAIALLTRRKWLEYAVFGLSAVGLVLGALAWLHI